MLKITGTVTVVVREDDVDPTAVMNALAREARGLYVSLTSPGAHVESVEVGDGVTAEPASTE